MSPDFQKLLDQWLPMLVQQAQVIPPASATAAPLTGEQKADAVIAGVQTFAGLVPDEISPVVPEVKVGITALVALYKVIHPLFQTPAATAAPTSAPTSAPTPSPQTIAPTLSTVASTFGPVSQRTFPPDFQTLTDAQVATIEAAIRPGPSEAPMPGG